MVDSSVLVLCGGRGKRLSARTAITPKALVPVHGKPILNYILEHFVRQGLSEFVFATGYLSEQIENHLYCEKPSYHWLVSNAGLEASMLQRIHAARDSFKKDTVIVSYGDTFIDISHTELLKTHRASGKMATLVTGKIQNPFGVVTIDSGDSSGAVRSFVEKPTYDYYIGCFVFDRRLFERMTPELLAKPDGQGLVELFQRLASEGLLGAYNHTGMQVTFNTEQELRQAHETLVDYFTVKED